MPPGFGPQRTATLFELQRQNFADLHQGYGMGLEVDHARS